MKPLNEILLAVVIGVAVGLLGSAIVKAQGSYGPVRSPERHPDLRHEEFHDWYRTLYMKERGYQHIKCCDDKDCQPVEFLGWTKDGDPKLKTRFGVLVAPFEKVQFQPTPDQKWHACLIQTTEDYGGGDNVITWYCVIAPEMVG